MPCVHAHALLVLDGASWHASNALRVPDNITLLPLPPYAPELNPIENVWAYLRANRLAISVFETYKDIGGTMLRRLELLRQRHRNRALDYHPRIRQRG